MRKLNARWDIDVPPSGVDEGDSTNEERVHLGVRLSLGRHEADTRTPGNDPVGAGPDPDSSDV